MSLFFRLNKVRLVRTAQTAQTMSPYIHGCGGGVLQSPVLARSQSRTRSLPRRVGLRLQEPGQLVLLCLIDTNEHPVDRLLIKNTENFYFLFEGFPYVIAPVFSTPAFSTSAVYSCIFHSCIFYSRIFSATDTIFADIIGLFSTTVNIIVLKICRIRWKKMQNNDYYIVEGHSRSSKLVPIESPYATSY